MGPLSQVPGCTFGHCKLVKSLCNAEILAGHNVGGNNKPRIAINITCLSIVPTLLQKEHDLQNKSLQVYCTMSLSCWSYLHSPVKPPLHRPTGQYSNCLELFCPLAGHCW